MRAALILAAALTAAAALSLGAAGAASRPGYAESVDSALDIVRSAPDGDRQSAAEAAVALAAGTGASQPEILADLNAAPPNLTDARLRLAALSRAVHAPAFTAEPAKADAALHGILAQPRYADLSSGPSFWDRVGDLLTRFVVWLFGRLGNAPAGLPGLLWLLVRLAAGAVVVAAAGFAVWNLAARRGGREASLAAACPPQPVARDWFADADRLAAAGELTAATRALAGGVATALGEERDWDTSPLTVREIFRRAADPGSLRPLLAAFEASVYGGRQPNREAYAHAAEAASSFRR